MVRGCCTSTTSVERMARHLLAHFILGLATAAGALTACVAFVVIGTLIAG